MADAPIAAIELHHIALPTRREHIWTGLTEPIGGYVLVKMTDAAGLAGWAGARAQGLGRRIRPLFRRNFCNPIESITRHLAPAVKGALPGEIAELHARNGSRHQGLSLRQGGGRIRRLRSCGKQMRPARCPFSWEEPAGAASR